MGGQAATQTSQDKNSYRTAERSQALAGHITGSSPHADILDLQHAAGNRAVSQLIQSDSNARLSTRGTKLSPLPSTSISPSDVEGLPDVVRSELTGDRGEPLDPETRTLMESCFGYDLGAVRIHTGPKAAESARAVNASAYTVGRDVVFGSGRYTPGTPSGQQLLAHELSHAIQQRPGASPAPSLFPHGQSERLAEHASQAALAHGTMPQPVISGVGMARQFGSRNVQELDDEELRREFELVNDRLAQPVNYPERDVDKAYEQELLQEMARRGIAETRSAPPAAEPQQPESVKQAPEKKTSPVSQWVRKTVEELDDSSSGKVILSYIIAVDRLDLLKQWALELKAIHHTKRGNYLLFFFAELQDSSPAAVKLFTERLAKKGVRLDVIALEWELHLLLVEEQSRPLKVRLQNYPVYNWKVGLGQFLHPVVEAINLIVHFVPVVGQALSGFEALIGREVLTGRKLEGWERFLGMIPYAGVIMRSGASAARAILTIARGTGLSPQAVLQLLKNTSALASDVGELRAIKQVVDQRGIPSAGQQKLLKAAHDSLKPIEQEVAGVTAKATQRAAPPQTGSYTVLTSGGSVRYSPPKTRVGAQTTPQKEVTVSGQGPAQVEPPKAVVPAPSAKKSQSRKATTQREMEGAAAQKMGSDPKTSSTEPPKTTVRSEGTGEPSVAGGKTALKPDDSVWVQLPDGRPREYTPSEVKGGLGIGAKVDTPEGAGTVVARGEPPSNTQVTQPPGFNRFGMKGPAAPPVTPEQTARRIANELRDEIVKGLSKPGRSGGAIGAQADKRVGAELIRRANTTADKALKEALRALGERLIERGKSGLHK